MDCETFRGRVAADPARLDEQCSGHAERCPACMAYSERLRNAEWLIHEALRFDVAALKAGAGRKPRGLAVLVRHRAVWAGVAATLVAAVAVWVGIGRGPEVGEDLLVAEILEHWHHEPASWVETDVRVSPASLEEVTGGRASVDANRLGLVSYARSCLVREHWVPHLVIQGSEGPVMLILLPQESVRQPLRLDLPEQGLEGVLLPVGEGSVAILGESGEPLERIRERVSDAVAWSI